VLETHSIQLVKHLIKELKMSQNIINIGATAGDRTGDSLRVAGQKINSNFSELYALAAANDLPSVSGQTGNALYTDGASLYWAPVTATNGVVTTKTYSDPSWLTGLSYGKLLNVPSASTTSAGVVRVDGTTITISNGIISASGVGTGTLSFFNNAMYNTTGLLVKNGTTGSNAALVIPSSIGTDPIQLNAAVGNVQIMSNQNTWIFGTNGALTFPDATIQTTAYLGTATTSKIGGVKPDGTTITINNGVISGANTYTLPTASTSVLGGVKVDGTSITIAGGVISVSANLTQTITFKGIWDASTNTPPLANGVGTTGWQYIVGVPGRQNLGAGTSNYSIGDQVIYDGAIWNDIPLNSGVTSFNTRTGAVTLNSSDVTTALGYTPMQPSSLSVATTSSSGGGSLTYSAGVFTFAPASIPTYTVNTGLPTSGGSLTLTGTTFTFNPASAYTLPTASNTTLGGIKIDNNTIVINNGVISVGGALTSATIFKGAWNVNTNTPTLINGTGTAGNEYIVSVAGTRNLGAGNVTYNVGDLVIYDGAKWVQIPGSNAVASFNSRTGAITLTTNDVTTALGYTPLSSLTITTNTPSGTTSTLSYGSYGALSFTPANPSSILGGLTIAASNGFTGSNSNGAITIQTSVTGLLLGNGTAISAATAGTDYQGPISATGLLKSNGTPGNVSAATAGTDYVIPAGNVATATKLATSRNINGVGFDGTSDITVKASPIADTIVTPTQSGSLAVTSAMYRVTFINSASVTSFTVTLPDTNTCTVGQSFIFVPNQQNYAWTVALFGGGSSGKTWTAGQNLVATVQAQRGGVAETAANWSYGWQGSFAVQGSGSAVMSTSATLTNTTLNGSIVLSGYTTLTHVGEQFSNWSYAVGTAAVTPTAVAASGVFTIPNTTGLSIGQAVTITGTNGGTGVISGYTTGTTYYVIGSASATGTTSVTLAAARNSSTPITTTAGTLSGLTMSFAPQVMVSPYSNVGGHILNITGSVSSNFDIGCQVVYTAGYAYTLTIIINQGSTPYIPQNFYLGAYGTYMGTSQTISWQGGSAPTGNANKKDVITLSWLPSSAYAATIVMGQLVSFG
jgi:hypothetical protein